MVEKFAAHITAEELAALPLLRFTGRMVVVDTEESLEEACSVLGRESVIGFDTETRPSFRPGRSNRVALLQLATAGTCYLFRLCRMPLAKPLVKLLEREDIIKVGADVQCDMNGLHKLRHFSEGGFADLQNMVADWGIDDRSLRKIAGIVLGQRISKAQRLSNWEAANLTEAQQLYASTDAWVCLEIYNQLKSTSGKL